MRRLSILLLLLPVLWIAGCSDSDSDTAATATATESGIAVTASPGVNAMTPAASSSTAVATISGTIAVDFTGAPQELEAIEIPFEVAPDSTAWDAIKLALGEESLSYQDFGGSLGIFVTGFNGVEAQGNNFWEFQVNDETATSGAQHYKVQQGDVLKFVYSSF